MAAPHGLMMAEPDQPESAAEHGGSLVLGFGERIVRIPAGTTFVVGRGADLSIGDNPYVHRRFLEIAQRDGVWWLSNVGSALTASVSSADGAAQSWLAPGSSMPLVFRTTTVMFTGDSTMYEVSLTVDSPVYEESVGWNGAGVAGSAAELLSPMQRILLTALAEPLLRDGDGARHACDPPTRSRRDWAGPWRSSSGAWAACATSSHGWAFADSTAGQAVGFSHRSVPDSWSSPSSRGS